MKDETVSLVISASNFSHSKKGNLYVGSHYGVHEDYIERYKIGSILTIMQHSEFYKYNLKNRLRILEK